MNEYRTFCVIADIMSLAGSKVSARSVSPGGSVVALSDRLSLASGSLPAAHDNPLTPQQLGVMGEFGFCIQKKKIGTIYRMLLDIFIFLCTGMEALETVINFWEDALVAYETPTTSEDSELCREIQSLLDLAWQLQDQSELLFLDQRSILFRNGSHANDRNALHRSMSDPNFDSAESFASALDQV